MTIRHVLASLILSLLSSIAAATPYAPFKYTIEFGAIGPYQAESFSFVSPQYLYQAESDPQATFAPLDLNGLQFSTVGVGLSGIGQYMLLAPWSSDYLRGKAGSVVGWIVYVPKSAPIDAPQSAQFYRLIGDGCMISTCGPGSTSVQSDGDLRISGVGVPEPATFGLMALGAMALMWRRGRST